jgi:hypothetical protein
MVKEISSKLPAYKEVSMIIKKAKIPVTARNAEYMIATVPNPELNLKVGDTYDWNTVLQYLKALTLVTKGDAGWLLADPKTGELTEYKTLDAIKTQYLSTPEFAALLRTRIIDRVLESGDIIEQIE